MVHLFQWEMCQRDLSKIKSSRVFPSVRLFSSVMLVQSRVLHVWAGLPSHTPPPPAGCTAGGPRVSDGAWDGFCKGSTAFSTGCTGLPGSCVPSWRTPQTLPPSSFTAFQLAGLKLSILETCTLRQLYFLAVLELHFWHLQAALSVNSEAIWTTKMIRGSCKPQEWQQHAGVASNIHLHVRNLGAPPDW